MIDNGVEYSEMLAELLSIIPNNQSTLRFRAGFTRTGHLAHGWYSRVHRTVEAVIVLGDAGFAAEAAPLRRSIIEHVVALTWLAVEGDNAVDAIRHAHAEWVKLTGKHVQAAGWTSVDLNEYENVVASAIGGDTSNDTMKRFWHQAQKYSSSDTVVSYLLETGRSHAMWESAAAYLDPISGNHLSLPREDIKQTAFAVTQLLLAISQFNALFVTVPWQGQFELICDRARVATIRERKKMGLVLPDVLDYQPLRDVL